MSMKNIIQTIKRNKRFLISTHVNPDPDALCSELALMFYLKSLGKQVSIINEEDVPKRYQFLTGVRHIRPYKKVRRINYDVMLVVDCGDLNRIGKVQSLIQDNKTLVNIDHHVTNDRFGNQNLVCAQASSTAEVLYELFSKMHFRLTRTLAAHLYVGIMTDTGSFRYENTTARTHAIISELMKHDISAPALYAKLYETISPSDLKNFTKTINSFDMALNKKVACVVLTKKVLSRFSGEFDLRDTIFKFLRSIKKTEVFVILTEMERNKTRINLRSSTQFDVAQLASYFGGGGHKRASGCAIDKSITLSRNEILKRIQKTI